MTVNKRILLSSLILVLGLSFYNANNFTAWNQKGLFIAAIIINIFVLYGFLTFIRNVIRGEYKKSFLIPFFLYSAFVCLMVIITYPAVISWGDMSGIYNSVLNGDAAWLFTYFTSVFHIAAKLLFPTIVAPAILQGGLIVAFAGHFSKRLNDLFGGSYLWGYLPFFMFPVIFYGLYPNRMPLYAFFYTFYFTEIILDYIVGIPINLEKIMFYFLGGVLITLWRKEGVLFLFFFPIVLILLKHTRFTLRNYVKSFVLLLLLYILFSIPQKVHHTEPGGVQVCTIIMSYLTALNYEGYDFGAEEDIEYLKVIGEYVSFEKIEEQVSSKGRDCLREVYGAYGDWCAWKKDPQKEDFTKFYPACFKLFMKHPILTFKARLSMCMYALVGEHSFVDDDPVYYIKNNYSGAENLNLTVSRYRKGFNYLFSGKVYPGGQIVTYVMTAAKKIMYNTLIPLLGMLILGLLDILKRKKIVYVLLFSWWGVHFITVFLTAPCGYFMYYLPFYLMGYLFIVIEKLRLKKNRMVVDLV